MLQCWHVHHPTSNEEQQCGVLSPEQSCRASRLAATSRPTALQCNYNSTANFTKTGPDRWARLMQSLKKHAHVNAEGLRCGLQVGGGRVVSWGFGLGADEDRGSSPKTLLQ